jgi:hypothetical protein
MKALIIQGPQGSGKSAIARAIAEIHGTVAVINAGDTWSGFWLSSALQDNPDVLIVEECRADTLTGNDDLLAIAGYDTICVPVKGMKPLQVKTPSLILVSNSADPIKLPSIDRRFVVLDTTNFYRDANQIHVTGSAKPEDFDKLLASIKPGAVTSISPAPEPISPVLWSAINELGMEAGVISKPITVAQVNESPIGEQLLMEVLIEVQLRQTRLSEGYERLRSAAVASRMVFDDRLRGSLERLNREIADGLSDQPPKVSAPTPATPAPSICPEGYEMRSKHSYQTFVNVGWTDSQLINVGYMQQIESVVPAVLSGELGETRIQRYDENNPVLEVVVADRTYSFTVRNVEENSHEWLMGVVSRQMQEIHDRAVHNTRQDIQIGMKKLLGIKS